MKKLLFASTLLFLFLCSCSDSAKTEDQKKRQAIRKAQVKTMQVIKYTYKFGEPDMTTGQVLLTADYDKDGNVLKEVYPEKIYTYAYKDIDKKKMLSDIQELNPEFLLQFQTNYEYAGDGSVTATMFSADETLISKTVFYKNTLGQDTTIISYNSKGLIDTKTVSVFDEIGLLQNVLYNGQDSVLVKTVRISGDKNKRNFISYNSAGLPTSVFTEIYDKDGYLVEYYENRESVELFKHLKNTYKDNLKEENIEYYLNGEPKTLTKWVYEKNK